jgi:hypothetical protein
VLSDGKISDSRFATVLSIQLSRYREQATGRTGEFDSWHGQVIFFSSLHVTSWKVAGSSPDEVNEVFQFT